MKKSIPQKTGRNEFMKKLLSVLLALVLLLGCTVCATTAAAETKAKKNIDETVTEIAPKQAPAAVIVDVPRQGTNTKTAAQTLSVGQTLKLRTGSKKEIKWTSSDKSVVAISGKNKAVAKNPGRATLTGTDGKEKYVVNLVVNNVLSVNKKTVNLKLKQKSYVTFTFTAGGYLTWDVANKSVVKAQWADSWKDGTIKLYLTGLKVGSTCVTVTNSYNSERIKVKVVVSKTGAQPTAKPTAKPTEKPSTGTKYRALLIGNANYSSNPLPMSKNNVNTMKGLLTKSLKTAYTVTAKYNASGKTILNAIKTAFKGAKSNDVSLFYYAGHGLQDTGALCGTDGSFVHPAQLRDALKAIPGKVIVILDCCHSGSVITPNGEVVNDDADYSADFNKAVVNAFSGYQIQFAETGDDIENTGELRQSKFIVLTACKKYETGLAWSYYGSGREKDGFFTFTKTLSNGLGLKWYAGTVENKTAPCDKNKNRVITLAEAYSYARANASKLNQQMGSAHTQSCMYYGNKDYALFRMK